MPAGSTARIAKVCDPATSPLYDAGEVQELKVALSSAHSNWLARSSAEKVKLAVVSLVALDGIESIVALGTTVSMVTVRESDGAERLPAASMAIAM